MEVDDIQTPQPACKFSRVNSNGRNDSSKIAIPHNHHNHHLDDSDDVVRRSDPTTTTTATATTAVPRGAEAVVGTNHRLRQWQHSSRIIRVSRASGGKDRHSKVWTAKGPRDRRVRLSVTTAIQFYDLQDRLGYDQPSKAVEWLIKAAAEAINELPSLNSSSTFPPPETPSPRQQLGNDQSRAAMVDTAGDSGDPGSFSQNHNLNQNQHQQQMGSSSMSSEASKGSGLSLSRSEIRVKARERARERIAKEKEKEKERETKPTITATATTTRVNNNNKNNNLQHSHHNQQQQQQLPQTSSFTQLLMAGVSNLNESNAAASSSPSAAGGSAHQGPRSGTNQWLTSASTTAMDYFGGSTVGLMGGSSSSRSTSGYSTGLIQVGSQVMSISPFSIGSQENQHQPEEHNSHEELHHHHQHLPFMADHHHLIQQAAAASNATNGATNGAAGQYNLNFSISSAPTSNSGGQLNGAGGDGFSSHNSSSTNRGTLQSNSPSLLPYLTRFSTDGSSVPFFLGGTAVENHNHSHHHHHHQFHPPGLQLCYGGNEIAATHNTRRGKEKSSTASTTTAAATTTAKSFSSNHSNSSLPISNLWTQVNNDGAA